MDMPSVSSLLYYQDAMKRRRERRVVRDESATSIAQLFYLLGTEDGEKRKSTLPCVPSSSAPTAEVKGNIYSYDPTAKMASQDCACVVEAAASSILPDCSLDPNLKYCRIRMVKLLASAHALQVELIQKKQEDAAQHVEEWEKTLFDVLMELEEA
jgi:hypothetical protein